MGWKIKCATSRIISASLFPVSLSLTISVTVIQIAKDSGLSIFCAAISQHKKVSFVLSSLTVVRH